MWRILVVLVVVGCGSAKAPVEQRAAPPPPSENRVAVVDPPLPTLRLPRHFTPTRYTAQLAIDPAKPDFDGTIAIEGTLAQPTSVIWLNGKHFTFTAAEATEGKHVVELTVTAKGDFLEVRAAQPLDAGAWTLHLTYRGKIEQNGFDGAFITKLDGAPYVITQFESTAARLVFPCIDEPDRKTPWQLTLDVPKGLVATSNTMPTETVAIDATHERIAFAVTKPLPSYLVAFAIGPFDVIDAGTAKSGLPLRVVTPRGTGKKVAFLVSALPRMVDALEAWFKIPFPYPKLDIVVAPSLRGGAMENAGMITTDSRIVMFEKPLAHERYEIVSVIGHETSHQWFGDLVTAAWWDDIWLNESFASWIEDKVLLAFDKTWPTQAIQYRQGAFRADELTTARKIHQPILTEGDIHNAFDSITYPKGSTVLRMIEHQMGEAAFQTAIQHYLEAHAYGNAKAADLFAALDTAGTPLGELATGWFEQAGAPEVTMALACDGGKARLDLAQKRYVPNPKPDDAVQTWTVPLCVAFAGAKHERLEQCTVMSTAHATIELPICPTWFAPAGDFGYYHARLDAKALEAIRDRGWAQLTPEEHMSIYADAATFANAGKPSVSVLWSLSQKLAKSGNLRELAVSLGDVSDSGNGGAGLPGQIAGAVPNDLISTARARARAIVEPAAKKYGLAVRDDDLVTANARSDLRSAVEWSRSTVLDAEAKKLVVNYRDLPTAFMGSVLSIAANADPKVAARLREDVVKEQDPVIHGLLLGALTGLHDPERHRAMVESLVPVVVPEDLTQLFWADDEVRRASNEAYIRAHLGELMKRLPVAENEDFPTALMFAYALTSSCDAARRDELAAYVTHNFGSLPSGARPTAQAIEAMDNCIARKKILEPSLRAWLTAKP